MPREVSAVWEAVVEAVGGEWVGGAAGGEKLWEEEAVDAEGSAGWSGD
jgi:hypothetical protein